MIKSYQKSALDAHIKPELQLQKTAEDRYIEALEERRNYVIKLYNVGQASKVGHRMGEKKERSKILRDNKWEARGTTILT